MSNKLKSIYFKKSTKVKILIITFFFITGILYWFCLPTKLFNDPVSTVIVDKNNELLGARIADDGQWRFPYNDSIPQKFKTAIIAFEDKRFYNHNGIDWLAIARAIWLNLKHRQIVSGGSTLTMQTIRLSRKGKARTVGQKLIEIILATRLEMRCSKQEILAIYASNAPFGGNNVGLDAASWRYFGRNADKLSWAEAATLAVLPNAPSLIHLGRNRQKLVEKRNQLLERLLENKSIDSSMYELALDEPIPGAPKPFPQYTPQLLNRAYADKQKNESEAIVKTTINANIQKRVNELVYLHHKKLKGNGIYNAAVLILEIKTGNTIAYVGNIPPEKLERDHYLDTDFDYQVDIIEAQRSTGSVLKPMLYAAMLHSGEILPYSLVIDIPTQIGGYAPQNYNMGYDGAVPANRAIARSLNVPAIRMLQIYGVERFHFLLKKIGLKNLNKPPSHYGLSLILGGCEGSLWELCGIYASMGRSLDNYFVYNGKYNPTDYHPPIYQKKYSRKNKEPDLFDKNLLSAASIWQTFNAMLEVERPQNEANWEMFSSSQKIAWKTGTSFGFRDAWAIGLNKNYVVGVWTGNADGEGRPGLVGIKTSAPLMFDVFDILPVSQKWFDQPFDEMIKAATCTKSGFLATKNCEEIDSIWIPSTGMRADACPYHKLIHLDLSENFQVHSNCESPSRMVHKPWFILPPAIEWYYQNKNADYKKLPPYRQDCADFVKNNDTQVMQIIYPHNYSQIYIPLELDGQKGRAVFEVAHRKPNTKIFWHLDNKFIGETLYFHQHEILSTAGKHQLTLIDENGEKLNLRFEIIDKE